MASRKHNNTNEKQCTITLLIINVFQFQFIAFICRGGLRARTELRRHALTTMMWGTMLPFLTLFVVVEGTCPAIGESLRMVFIGNSYLGGTLIGRACDDEDAPLHCRLMACPGNVAGFSALTYPSYYDRPPGRNSSTMKVDPDDPDSLIPQFSSRTMVHPDKPYNPISNPHRGDVPGKIKLIGEYICGGFFAPSDYKSNVIQYVQNTQSKFGTRSHTGRASTNPDQRGTFHLLNTYDGQGDKSYDAVLIQPMSTEYLKGRATSSRIEALTELLRTDRAASKGSDTRYVVLQTWPRRESNLYNHMCTTTDEYGEEKIGMMDNINKTLVDLATKVPTDFTVAPAGSAFVEFAKLACPGIMFEGQCAFNSSMDCPIWFGVEDKVSLYEEGPHRNGTHQSEEVGAWLVAAVLFGTLQSDTPCYVTETDISEVMPIPPNLATIPSGKSIHNLVADAARLALMGQFGDDINACGSIASAGTDQSRPPLSPQSNNAWRRTQKRLLIRNRAKFKRKIGPGYTALIQTTIGSTSDNIAFEKITVIDGNSITPNILTVKDVFKKIIRSIKDDSVRNVFVLYGKRGVPKRVVISRSNGEIETIRIQQMKKKSMATEKACPLINDPLRMVVIGNTYLGGISIGRACDDEPVRDDCNDFACPGNVAGYSKSTYPDLYDRPPDSSTLLDRSKPYSPYSNPHKGDVPGKMKSIAAYLCGKGNVVQYVQNTQSKFTSRSHSGQSSSNPHMGTLRLLDTYDGQDDSMYNAVVVQPHSTELLKGATDTRISAMAELLRVDRAAARPNETRYVIVQTWPYRESGEYNQICATNDDEGEEIVGMLENIDFALDDMGSLVPTDFLVAPAGSAFIEFAKLACPGIVLEGQCALNPSFDCPIWFGEEDKVSLYAEKPDSEGAHQSEEVGAWLVATVLFGTLQSDTPCYVTETDLSAVMPIPPNLATIPSGKSIHNLVSDAARLALMGQFGDDINACGGSKNIMAEVNTSKPSVPS